jgi:hypothetical protein
MCYQHLAAVINTKLPASGLQERERGKSTDRAFSIRVKS